jgi:CRP/FNR family transcriptional regulator
MLYEVGSRPGLIGILRKGVLRRERLMPDGRRTVLGLVFPGGVVGEMPGWPASYSLETATAAEVCVFPSALTRRLVEGSLEFRRGIAVDLERQYGHELSFAWLRVGLRCKERVVAFLVLLADLLQVEPESDGSVVLDVPVGRRDWADLSNTTVESISRQITELSSEGLVEHVCGRSYHLRNMRALREISGLKPVPSPHVGRLPMTAVNADRPVAMPSAAVRAPVHAAARSQ